MVHDPTPTPPAAALAEMAWVRALARSLLHDPSLADDVAQDTWLAAQTSPPTRRDADGGLRGWLRTVVTNRVRRLHRADRRRRARETAASLVRQAADPAEVAARAALQQRVTAAVMALDEPFRSALLWRYLDELPATEIARRQGIRHDAARKRLSRGLQLLRERLDQEQGGFAAFAAAWTTAFGPTTNVAAPAAAITLLTLTLMNKWLLLLGGALAATLWFSWPAAPAAPPTTSTDPTGAAVVAQAPTLPAPLPTAAARHELAAAGQLVLRITDDAGRALAQVHVLALHRGELSARTTTADDGRATLPAAVEADEWLLARPGTVPLRLPRAAATAAGAIESSLVLPRGEALRGEVHGGCPPGATLQLEHDTPPPFAHALGERAMAALAELGVRPASLTLAIGADRTFCGDGLPADWSGALRAPAGFTMHEAASRAPVEDHTLLLLRRPRQDLVLELTAPRIVRGRVLAADAPFAGGEVYCVAARSPVDMQQARVATDADGRFRAAVQDVAAGGALAVEVLVAGDGSLLRHDFELPAGVSDHDLGELRLGGALEVTVVDAGGEALPGARVFVVGNPGESADATTAQNGRVHFRALPAAARALVATAPGFTRARLDLPATGAITVQLRRCPSLRVRVLAADGSPAPALALRVRAERLPFRSVDAAAAALANSPFAATMDLDARSEAELTDLEPGLLLQLAAIDTLGKELANTEVTTPRTDTCETVVLTTAQRPFVFTGTVRDGDGRPVPRARLHIESDGGARHARTDAKGGFRLDGLTGTVTGVHLEVSHPAYVTWLRSDLTLSADDAPLDVVLESGRRLEVRVVQANGEPLDFGLLLAALDGGRGDLAQRSAAGTFVFDMLPQRAGRVFLELGGQELGTTIGALDSFAELRLPELGSVAVHHDPGDDNGTRVHVAVTNKAGKQSREWLRPGSSVLVLPLPPGEYRLQLERRRSGRRGAEKLGEPRAVTVRAGERQELVLP
ncbi:MAG: sigma-70 family RNA polymerase sigma factor [Planctomycetes bacterium]|nr:sigma-70 family RNA polymerase sigma factor [Planctomycetota bacterium]